jgi:hypothetical protein
MAGVWSFVDCLVHTLLSTRAHVSTLRHPLVVIFTSMHGVFVCKM